MALGCFPAGLDFGVELISAVGGFLGGLSVLIYMRPANTMDGVRRVVISVVASVLGSSAIAFKVFGAKDPEYVMMVAFLIGFCAWSLLGAIAKFFEGQKHQDIVGMLKSFNGANRPEYGGGGGFYRATTPAQPMPKHEQIDNPD